MSTLPLFEEYKEAMPDNMFFDYMGNRQDVIERFKPYWDWLKSCMGQKLVYEYDNFGNSIKEKLVLVGAEMINGDLMLSFKTDTGKKIWYTDLIGSPFYKHWEANVK